MRKTGTEGSQIIETISSRKRGVFRGAVGLASAASATGAYCAAEHFGVLDYNYAPEVPVFEQTTDAIITANEILREASPAVFLGAVAILGAINVVSRRDIRTHAMNELSKVSYSGKETSSKEQGVLRKVGATAASTAALGTLFIAASSGIEHDVGDKGPNRVTATIGDALLDPNAPDNQRMYVMQDDDTLFMLDSYLPQERTDALVSAVDQIDGTAYPFSVGLPSTEDKNSEGRFSLIVSLPGELLGQEAGVEIDCSNVPITVDTSANLEVGDRVDVNNTMEGVVTAETSDMSFMSRSGVVMSNEAFNECYVENPDNPYFGVAISNVNESQVEELMEESGLQERAVIISEEQLEDNNRKFWKKSVDPLIFQMMGYIAGFAFVANRNDRTSRLQHSRRELATLNATGVKMNTIKKVETIRALRETTYAAAVAAPLAPLLSAAANTVQEGLRVGIGVKEVATGAVLTLGAKVFSSRRAVRKMAKEVTPADGMKG